MFICCFCKIFLIYGNFLLDLIFLAGNNQYVEVSEEVLLANEKCVENEKDNSKCIAMFFDIFRLMRKSEIYSIATT